MSKQTLFTMSFVTALCVLGILSTHARAAGQDGMVVVRDAQSGQLRAPTAAESQALRAAAPPNTTMTAARPAAAATLTRPNGARGVRVGESTMVYDVVTRGADGKLSSECVQGAAAAERALQHPNADHASDPTHADQEHAHESR